MNKLLFTIFVALMSFTHNVMAGFGAYTMTFTESQVQTYIDGKSPFSVNKFNTVIGFGNNRIEFLNTGRAQIDSNVTISTIMIQHRGTAVTFYGNVKVSGIPSFDSTQGSFYLQQVTVDSIKIEGIADKYNEITRQMVGDAMRKHLDRNPVYVLKDNDMKQKLLKSTLKEVKIEQSKIFVTLDLVN